MLLAKLGCQKLCTKIIFIDYFFFAQKLLKVVQEKWRKCWKWRNVLLDRGRFFCFKTSWRALAKLTVCLSWILQTYSKYGVMTGVIGVTVYPLWNLDMRSLSFTLVRWCLDLMDHDEHHGLLSPSYQFELGINSLFFPFSPFFRAEVTNWCVFEIQQIISA